MNKDVARTHTHTHTHTHKRILLSLSEKMAFVATRMVEIIILSKSDRETNIM